MLNVALELHAPAIRIRDLHVTSILLFFFWSLAIALLLLGVTAVNAYVWVLSGLNFYCSPTSALFFVFTPDFALPCRTSTWRGERAEAPLPLFLLAQLANSRCSFSFLSSHVPVALRRCVSFFFSFCTSRFRRCVCEERGERAEARHCSYVELSWLPSRRFLPSCLPFLFCCYAPFPAARFPVLLGRST